MHTWVRDTMMPPPVSVGTQPDTVTRSLAWRPARGLAHLTHPSHTLPKRQSARAVITRPINTLPGTTSPVDQAMVHTT